MSLAADADAALFPALPGTEPEGPPFDPRFTGGTAFVDGEYVPILEARIPLIDRGFLRSDATYDVFHVWRGYAFRLEDHLDRFERNMGKLHFKIPYDKQEIGEICLECVRRSGLTESFVLMTATRGFGPAGTRDPRLCTNRFYAYAVPFVWIADEAARGRGFNLHVSGIERIRPQSVDPTVKNFHWMDLTLGQLEAYDAGCDTEVLVDSEGHITEGPGFNVFVVKGGRISTPEGGVFDGMTRRTVIEMAADLQNPVTERLVAITELSEADEVFLSSTAGGIIPVTRIDGKPLGDGKPGRLTRRMHDLYWGQKAKGWLGTKVYG